VKKEMKFRAELTSKAVKDLKYFPEQTQKAILKEILSLEKSPFPFKKKIKKIKGVKFACYRLRLELKNDSLRVFYGIDNDIIFVLRIISKKNADKILKSISKSEFPPFK
jgi:mRNA-degrading endonuclease RelE of RelBE toxin-antitoxin system